MFVLLPVLSVWVSACLSVCINIVRLFPFGYSCTINNPHARVGVFRYGWYEIKNTEMNEEYRR